VPCALGFNRRFDPQFSRLKQRVSSGELGALEAVIIISRDPAPPPIEYVKVSGGLFRDMMIHDFDMARWIMDEEARWIMDEEFETVQATGSVLVDNAIGVAGDIDSATVTMRTASGKIANAHSQRQDRDYL